MKSAWALLSAAEGAVHVTDATAAPNQIKEKSESH